MITRSVTPKTTVLYMIKSLYTPKNLVVYPGILGVGGMTTRIILRNDVVDVNGRAYSAPQIVLKGVFTGEIVLTRDKIEGVLTADTDPRVLLEENILFVDNGVELTGTVNSIDIRGMQRDIAISTGIGKYRGSEVVVRLENTRSIISLSTHPLNARLVFENSYIEVKQSFLDVIIKVRSL